jgi:hypothetical protein
MNNDVTGDLIHDQKSHIVGDEIVGSQSIYASFAVGDARPDREINNGGDQPVEQVHDEVGAVLPLLRPVDLPEALEDFEHKNSSLR